MATALVLPESPTSNDVWLCLTGLDTVIEELERTGVDAEQPLDEDANPNRVLPQYMLPYMHNLQEVTHELLDRAQAAKKQYLQTRDDFDFDRIGLHTTILQIEALHDDVDWYTEATENAASMPEDEQRQYLGEFVYMPVFRGAGFAEPGDPDSPWESKHSAWCQPIGLGAQLETAVAWHEAKHAKMAKPKPVQTALWSLLGVGVIYVAYRVTRIVVRRRRRKGSST